MEEAQPLTSEASSVNVELDGEGMLDELTIVLTRAQLTIINEFLKEHIQPKGYEMISFAYDLFTRLNNALETKEGAEEAGDAGGDF